jgi:peptidoglycan/LPS O-acetylase OafA/YrhL
MTYRRDIDGLRAVAVLPVILFHARLGVFSGGYVGVDVFFVISGYLITTLLRAELDTARFSIVRFYERRVRRLFPALFAMVAATSAGAWCLLSPDALREFGQSVAATSVFASNIFFWLESGYFARASESLPLLHTWSLAVEEQYYVVFPPLLWLLARAGRRAIVVGLALLTALSFAAAVWTVSHNPDQAFYLPHLRAWELFIGALAAYDLLPALHWRPLREAVAGTGLVAIAIALICYDAATPFPGLAALLPCLGALAIIHAGAGGPTAVARLLSTRVAVGIGLMSYSLYLWHWPLLVLQRHYTILPPSTREILAALAVTFIAAWLSWRFVERPFRGSRLPATRTRLFVGAGAMLALFMALGLAAHFEQGFPTRYSAQALAAGVVLREDRPLRQRCFQLAAEDYAAGKVCRFGPPEAAPEFILWGDSHALMLVQSFMRLADASKHAGLFFGATGCPPLFDINASNRSAQWRRTCQDTNAAVRAELNAHAGIKTVIMVARWALYVEGRESALAPSLSAPLLVDAQHATPDSRFNAEVVERALRRTLSDLRSPGRRALVLEAVPEVAVSVPDAIMAQAAILSHRIDIAPSVVDYRLRQARTRALFERVGADFPEFEFVPLADALCGDTYCRTTQDGKSLYYDDNHLAPRGVALLEDRLAALLGVTSTTSAAAR